jgi:hypothetical protein
VIPVPVALMAPVVPGASDLDAIAPV